MKRTTHLLVASAFVLAGCSADSPLPTDHHAHGGGLALSDLTTAGSEQSLAALRQFTASFQDTTKAIDAGFTIFVHQPQTAADGCISDASPGAGGMGYHYINDGGSKNDDVVELLDPEFLVYAPDKGPSNNGDVRRRLAAVEYFIPFSEKFPGSADKEHFKQAPRLHDFPTMSQLPDAPFTEITAFGGWMFHIWVWENNPDGIFSNFNSAVPLCG